MGRNQQIPALKIGNQMRSPAALHFSSNKAYRGLVCCGCPSVGLTGLGGATIPVPEAVRILLKLAMPGFEPRSPAFGVYAHNHSSTHERCSVWLP